MKYDDYKPRLDLVPPHALLEVSRVLMKGADKYGVDNYLLDKDVDEGRYIAAALRHINAYLRGEVLDMETDMPHIVHAACNMLMLRERQIRWS